MPRYRNQEITEAIEKIAKSAVSEWMKQIRVIPDLTTDTEMDALYECFDPSSEDDAGDLETAIGIALKHAQALLLAEIAQMHASDALEEIEVML